MFAASKSGQSAVVAPTTDPFFPYVPLLLDTGDSSSRSTTVVDSSTNNFTVTRTGAPSTAWTSPYQTNGYWGWYFGGTGNYAVTNTAPLATTTTTFTIECWIYPTATPVGTIPSIVGDMQPTAGSNNLSFGIPSSNLLQLYWYDGAVKTCTGNTTISLNRWTHIAVSVNANAITLYVNGVSQTLTGTTTLTNRIATNGYFALGQYNTANHYYTGYISNLSVLNGTAKYSTGFTPTTSPLSVSTTNQTLLVCYSNRFIDSNTATTAKTITTTGTPQVTPYYYPSGFTAPASSIGAGYFNGTADYLSVANNAAFNLGTTFTIEFWVYRTTTTARRIISRQDGTSPFNGYNISYAEVTAGSWTFDASGTQITFADTNINTWTHFAWSVNATAATVYRNGISVGTATQTAQTPATNTTLLIGVKEGLTNYFSGYISNLRIVKGTAVYTGAFTPPTLAFLQTSGSASAASYPSTTNVNTSFAAANTSLLIDLADSNFVSATNGVQNNTFIDNSNYAFPITRTGTPTQGSVTPYWPNGYWGNYFGTANTDYLSVTSSAVLAFGTGAYSVEFWIYLPSYNNPNRVIDLGTATGSFGVQINNTGTIAITKSGSADVFTSSAGFTLNAWNHVAVVRTSTAASGTAVYLNGASLGTTTDANNWTVVTTPRINGASFGFVGYVSNLRVVKGVAVYTGAFTPPTSPLAATQSAGTNIAAITGTATSLLTCQSNRFIDNSTNALTITANGTPRTQAFQPFSPTASYTPATYGGSGYLGGNGNYLTGSGFIIPATSTTFTIECWIYPTVTPTGTIPTVLGVMLPTAATNDMSFGIPSSRLLQLYWFDGAVKTATGNTTIPLNAWTHIAVSVTSNAIALYVNGVSQTLTGTTTLTNRSASTGSFTFGQNNSASHYYTGYISNARVVNGIPVYTGAFTPPTLAPLTAAGSTSAASYSSTTNVNTVFNAASTSLLTNFTNAAIYDAAVQNDAITVGDAQASTTQYKWSPTSMKFDGTGDWLTTIDGPQLQLGTGDFTIDGWVYLSATGVAYGIISKGTASTGWSVNVTSGNKLQFSYTASNLTGATSLAATTWYYFAVVRSGSATGNLKVYLNGSVDATSGGAVTDNFNQTDILYVGASRIGATPLNGYLQDVRITKYARTITTPTAAFPTR